MQEDRSARAGEGILFVPHCDKSNVNLAANLHLSAAVPNCPFAESPISTPLLYKEITNERFEPGSDGRIKLPDTPGLGVTLNKRVLNRDRVDISDFRYKEKQTT
jgi:L-alanine-DL-glutamate epimerase-like enolase superfamily enzyme